MRSPLLSLGLAVGLLLTAAPAQASDEETLDLGSHPRRCDEAVARRVSLDRLLSDPEAYRGQCVSVQGYWAFRAAFSQAMAPARRYSNADPEVARYRIGLYLPDDGSARIPREPVRARIIGVVSDCSCLYGPDTVIVLGYCHYTSGPFLDVRRVRTLD